MSSHKINMSSLTTKALERELQRRQSKSSTSTKKAAKPKTLAKCKPKPKAKRNTNVQVVKRKRKSPLEQVGTCSNKKSKLHLSALEAAALMERNKQKGRQAKNIAKALLGTIKNGYKPTTPKNVVKRDKWHSNSSFLAKYGLGAMKKGVFGPGAQNSYRIMCKAQQQHDDIPLDLQEYLPEKGSVILNAVDKKNAKNRSKLPGSYSLPQLPCSSSYIVEEPF